MSRPIRNNITVNSDSSGDFDISFGSVRKNLNILSVVIIFLAFSRVEITKFNLLGLGLEITEISRFYIGLYCIYIFFVWRYFTKLQKEEVRKGFTKYIKDKIHAYFKSNWSKHFKETIEIDGFEEKLSFKNIGLGIDPVSLLKIKIDGYYSSNEKGHTETIEIGLIKILGFRVYVWQFLKYSFLKDKFGDVYFPIVLIAIFVYLFACYGDWQGGFSQIINSF
ncbi:hypothetical protein [Reichenbachiella versicolor]|uniref:hypothetical protein n=1 Tax=Reichenbachiella versicolor TaxID=1821036 RepID=UPI000D6E87B8|nr:hypothetical protein [Reichenbachiella versicolor]